MNFFKFLRALKPGTVLYDKTTNHLLISCGCKPLWYRFIFGLNLKTEHRIPIRVVSNTGVAVHYEIVKIELTNVMNLSNYEIIGSMK